MTKEVSASYLILNLVSIKEWEMPATAIGNMKLHFKQALCWTHKINSIAFNDKKCITINMYKYGMLNGD